MSSASMRYLSTISQTSTPSSPHKYGKPSAKFWAQLPASPQNIKPQTDSHMEQANQYLESASNCVTLHQPSSWSTHLSEIEYAHNFLISSATGTSPFMAALGYQPPLFPIQEEEISVPSAQANLQRCRQVWRAARAASSHQKREPWLIIDEPLLLPTTQGKRYGSPPATSLFKWSPVSWHLATLTLLDLRVINPAAVRLKLPHSL